MVREKFSLKYPLRRLETKRTHVIAFTATTALVGWFSVLMAAVVSTILSFLPDSSENFWKLYPRNNAVEAFSWQSEISVIVFGLFIEYRLCYTSNLLLVVTFPCSPAELLHTDCYKFRVFTFREHNLLCCQVCYDCCHNIKTKSWGTGFSEDNFDGSNKRNGLDQIQSGSWVLNKNTWINYPFKKKQKKNTKNKDTIYCP